MDYISTSGDATEHLFFHKVPALTITRRTNAIGKAMKPWRPSKAQVDELDRRIKRLTRTCSSGSRWIQVKSRIKRAAGHGKSENSHTS